MSKRNRYSEPRQVVEVTAQCFQGRFLLEAEDLINRRFVGVWAKAQEKYDIHVYFLVTMSNHFHALISAPNQVQLSRFMNVVQTGTSREIGRLIGWEGSFWDDRYGGISVLEDDAALQRLQYLISNSVKEGLVAHPDDWPLVHSSEALVGSMALEGEWVDRTKMNRKRGKDEADFTEKVRLKLSPLPMFEGMGRLRFQEAMKGIVKEVVKEHAKVHDRRAARNRCRKALKKRRRFHRPARRKKTPAPMCHSVCERARKAYEEGYRGFVQLYREASERLRESLGLLGYPSYSQVMSLALME